MQSVDNYPFLCAEIIFEEPSQFIEQNSSQINCFDAVPSATEEGSLLLAALTREDARQPVMKPPLVANSKVNLVVAQNRIIKLAHS